MAVLMILGEREGMNWREDGRGRWRGEWRRMNGMRYGGVNGWMDEWREGAIMEGRGRGKFGREEGQGDYGGKEGWRERRGKFGRVNEKKTEGGLLMVLKVCPSCYGALSWLMVNLSS